MNDTTDEITEMFLELRLRDYWMSMIPVSQWRHRLDAQQAILELWFREDWPQFKYHFQPFQTTQEQSEQFYKILNNCFAQMHEALLSALTLKQEAQFNDAVYKVSKILRSPEKEPPDLCLDVPPDQRNHPKACKWSVLRTLTLDKEGLAKLVAYFLIGDGKAVWDESSLNFTILSEEISTVIQEEKPDLIADKLVPTFGDNTWLWLQALYETWMWPLSQTKHLPYPFKQNMNSSHKASLMKRIVAYHRKTARLSLADDRCPFRPVSGMTEEEKRTLENKLKAVSESLEEAHKRQENISINELLQPFKQKDQWFCQDLFSYLLKTPLSFFDFLQVPQDTSLSESPFRKGFSREGFLKATEEVGKYLPYNATGSNEDFAHIYSWLKEHSQTLNAYSHQLEWEMQDKSRPLDSMPFSKWLADVSAQLLETASRWNTRSIIWTDVTSIRDFMASWRDPDIQFPTLDDFANITITRESLEILDDFAFEHFNKSAKEMAYWDLLRRPTLYLLAKLYQEGFFNKLPESSTTYAPENKTGLNTFEKKSLEDLCKEMVREMNPYVFNQSHNGLKYKTFWFLEEWPEYKRMFAARIRPEELLLALQSRTAILLPPNQSIEEAIYDRYAPDGVSVETMEQLAKELIPIPKGLQEAYKKQGQHLTQVFINKVLDYAQAEGSQVEQLRVKRHIRKLDQPLTRKTDQWDILQAAWELATEQNIPSEAEQKIIDQFPEGQSKEEQITCLKAKLKFLLETSSKPRSPKTPNEILNEALAKITERPEWLDGEIPLRARETAYTPRFFWEEYLPYKPLCKKEDGSYGFELKGHKQFGTDFWLFLADKVNRGEELVPTFKSIKNDTETYNLYTPIYLLQSIEKRLNLHVIPDLLSYQERYKQILMTLRAPSEAYNLTEDEQWSYIVNEVNRQYPLTGSLDENCKSYPTDNNNETSNFSPSGTHLPYEKERQKLPRQLFYLFEYLLEIRTVSQIKTHLWEEQAEMHEDSEAQTKVSQLKTTLKKNGSDWQVYSLKTPKRYGVQRKPIEN